MPRVPAYDGPKGLRVVHQNRAKGTFSLETTGGEVLLRQVVSLIDARGVVDSTELRKGFKTQGRAPDGCPTLF